MSMENPTTEEETKKSLPPPPPPRALTLLEELLVEAKAKPKTEFYETLKLGLSIVLREVVLAERVAPDELDRAFVDLRIALIDQRLSQQVDDILHHPTFQRLEAAWRGLKFLVDRTDFRENIRIEMLNCSKDDLLTDFEDSPEVPKSGLYKIVYSTEFGQFGGKPFAAILANYDFGPGPQDITLLQKCGSVAAVAHAPFCATASPQFFGLDTFLNLPHLSEIRALFEGPQYTKYQALRETDDARYLALLLPRMLLRLPYGPQTSPVRDFNYEENVVGSHAAYLWGSVIFAFGTRLCESFARYRWCPHIVGPQSGGSVENLVLHAYQAMGEIQTKIPTEIMLTERREAELAEEGFIPFVFRKETGGACFFSANSLQKPKNFGQSKEGREAELNYRLGTQLPYMFIMNRLSHYIKVLQREQIGTWKERNDLQSELNNWINQFVSDMENASPAVRAKRPLRKAKVVVSDIPGNSGWYKVEIEARPHFKYMGAQFNLNLVGKLDRE